MVYSLEDGKAKAEEGLPGDDSSIRGNRNSQTWMVSISRREIAEESGKKLAEACSVHKQLLPVSSRLVSSRLVSSRFQ